MRPKDKKWVCDKCYWAQEKYGNRRISTKLS